MYNGLSLHIKDVLNGVFDLGKYRPRVIIVDQNNTRQFLPPGSNSQVAATRSQSKGACVQGVI